MAGETSRLQYRPLTSEKLKIRALQWVASSLSSLLQRQSDLLSKQLWHMCSLWGMSTVTLMMMRSKSEHLRLDSRSELSWLSPRKAGRVDLAEIVFKRETLISLKAWMNVKTLTEQRWCSYFRLRLWWCSVIEQKLRNFRWRWFDKEAAVICLKLENTKRKTSRHQPHVISISHSP